MFTFISSGLSFFSSLVPLLFPFAQNLEYEYTVLALISLYLCFFLTPFFFTRGFSLKIFEDLEKKKLSPFFQVILISPLVFLLVPFFMFQTKLCLCSEEHFFRWFSINVYPGVVLAHVFFLYVLKRTAFQKSRKKTLSLSLLFTVFFLLQSLLFFWIFPQKRQTHFLWGHLHGPIYDFVISLDAGAFLARGAHFFLGLALFAWLLKRRRVFFLFLVPFSLLYGASFFYPSTQLGSWALERNFETKFKGKGFDLFYNGKNLDPKRMSLFKKEVAFHMQELTDLLDLGGQKPVKIFVYDTYKQKKLLFGASQTDVTDIFTPSIHLGSLEFPHSSLRHELVHALVAKEAPLGLGFHPNMALTEGIAVALAPERRVGTLHQGAAHLLHHRKIGDIKNLFSPYFWKYSGARAYTVSGSLIQFLIEKKGARYVKKMYGTFSLTEALGEDEDFLISEWKKYISHFYTPERDDLVYEKFYRYPGILQDRCPHSKAELPGDSAMTSKEYLTWLRSLDPKDSKAFLRDLHFDLRGELSKNFEAFTDLARSKLDQLITFQGNKRNNYDFYEIKLLETDLLRLTGQKLKSLKILSELKEKLEQASLGESLTRQILARFEVEKLDSESLGFAWRRYLAGFGPMPKKGEQENSWIFSYLRFRNQYMTSRGGEALPSFQEWESFLSKNEIPSSFKKEWLRLLALESFYKKKASDGIQYWESLSSSSLGRNKELYQLYVRLFSSF